jgi:glutaryl-CoA dehydrogenase
MLDYYKISEMFTSEKRQTQEMVREFLDENVIPHINDWWEEEIFPESLVPDLGRLGLLGANLPAKYGTAGISNVAYGLVMYELERADSGLRSFASVQGALVMYPIHAYGSEAQQIKYLPGLAKGELIGCFGLTEHEGGSDPGAMSTHARKQGSGYLLNGRKMWISNGNVADVALIWASDGDGIVRGFLVDADSPGFNANPIRRKMSLRVSVTSELVLDDVWVDESQMLPGVIGLKGPLSCLTQARYGIAWGALGSLEAVYDESLRFTRSRTTFGRPIASRQLVQQKLVDMMTDHTKGLLLAWRLGRLKDEGSMDHNHVSVAKRDNVRAALNAARSAREILGASGITLDYHAIRHMLNLETVDTYEGTYDIHTLILGRDITGENALT